MHIVLKVDGTTLPSPTDINISDEILWSTSTGRSSETGEMLGAVISTKRTLEVEWKWITASEFSTIKDALPRGFFNNVVYGNSNGDAIITLDKAYRGNIQREDGGYIRNKGGSYTHYYKSVKIQIIEK